MVLFKKHVIAWILHVQRYMSDMSWYVQKKDY